MADAGTRSRLLDPGGVDVSRGPRISVPLRRLAASVAIEAFKTAVVMAGHQREPTRARCALADVEAVAVRLGGDDSGIKDCLEPIESHFALGDDGGVAQFSPVNEITLDKGRSFRQEGGRTTWP